MTDTLDEMLKEMREHTKFLKLFYKKSEEYQRELEKINLLLYQIRENTGELTCQRCTSTRRPSYVAIAKEKLKNLFVSFRERLIS